MDKKEKTYLELNHLRTSATSAEKKYSIVPPSSPIIDVNITLGEWPMRRVPCDDPNTLIEKLRNQNVTEAWAGHYDGLFHTDLTDVNNRLTELCQNRPHSRGATLAGPPVPQLIPFGSINPVAPNWESELDRCATIHNMPGVRLHPNYHNYKLDHTNVAAFLKAATAHKLIVQLTILMEDARMMHPLMQVPPVDITPLEKLVSQTPGVRLVLLNSLTSASRTDKLYRLTNAGEVYVDIAMLETLAALETLVNDIPVERILFGSHAPSFYVESAALKLQESNLPAAHHRAITHENARRLLPAT
jgi:predicted TIM-barrel fold metal-dependent hydrolase